MTRRRWRRSIASRRCDFETARTSLQGSTHVVWLSDDEIVTPIGEHFYAFKLERSGEIRGG